VAGIADGNGLGQQDLTDLIMKAGAKGLTVIVDDAELLAEGPVSDVLTAFLKAARDNRSALVLSGESGELNQFRGFIPEARKSKTGLLLCPPATTEGDLLGVRLPRTALFSGPPGRGLVVRNGEMTAVQVPIDDFQDTRSHG
jgi:S-DNA-T family DNA segregation ATPase FtsK/SpoIIIE